MVIGNENSMNPPTIPAFVQNRSFFPAKFNISRSSGESFACTESTTRAR